LLCLVKLGNFHSFFSFSHSPFFLTCISPMMNAGARNAISAAALFALSLLSYRRCLLLFDLQMIPPFATSPAREKKKSPSFIFLSCFSLCGSAFGHAVQKRRCDCAYLMVSARGYRLQLASDLLYSLTVHRSDTCSIPMEMPALCSTMCPASGASQTFLISRSPPRCSLSGFGNTIKPERGTQCKFTNAEERVPYHSKSDVNSP
jgi:hypothetical protein